MLFSRYACWCRNSLLPMGCRPPRGRGRARRPPVPVRHRRPLPSRARPPYTGGKPAAAGRTRARPSRGTTEYRKARRSFSYRWWGLPWESARWREDQKAWRLAPSSAAGVRTEPTDYGVGSSSSGRFVQPAEQECASKLYLLCHDQAVFTWKCLVVSSVKGEFPRQQNDILVTGSLSSSTAGSKHLGRNGIRSEDAATRRQ